MKDALFQHKKTGGMYTVVARVTASLPGQERLRDDEKAGVRRTDHGFIAVQMPNLMLDYEPTVQATEGIENGTQCVLYRGTDGRHWLRPVAEFTDGRFEPMNMRAGAMMPAVWHLTGQA